ncbi:hypothetical protein F3J38_21975 [Pantoea sp. Acro-805]|uniref:Uncharacterized protein n=1 Tax=Candidatus Pantoea formicae TaxID=2608355 RepID=A0ABX0R0F1_9GAMM|nr:hypothetical protein [Pantoea formicae]MDF7651019.1 hypothetical protein [Erwiniaceae bacterium L1_54_3]NIF02682.1 hypothetical protein [Pantoea formicae]
MNILLHISWSVQTLNHRRRTTATISVVAVVLSGFRDNDFFCSGKMKRKTIFIKKVIYVGACVQSGTKYGLLTYTGLIAAKFYVMSDSGFFSHRLLLP